MLCPMTVERALVVTAHPDDVDFGAAGTIAAWTSAGIEVTYCVATDGDRGGFDPAVSRSEIPGIRRAEQVRAAEAVGVHDVRFLGYLDGAATVTLDLRRDIARVIRQVRPQRVLTHSPERNWSHLGASHPDHLAVGEATVCAVYPDARNPFQFPELLAEEGLVDHIVGELWLMGGPRPNEFSDVTETFERKIAAVQSHASQMSDPSGGAPTMLRTRLEENAERGGLPGGHLAEAFQVVRIT